MDREILMSGAKDTAARLRLQLAQMTAASQVLERMDMGERARAYLAVLNQGICRMLRIVGRIELTDRLTDEDEIRLHSELIDLGPWIREMVERAQGVLREAAVELTYQGPETLMANVDRGLVKQLLLELLGAAASPGNQVSLTMDRQEDNVCFLVRGVGTQQVPEDLARMFDEPGGDLGDWQLSLARQIAELHGGNLMTETADGGVTLAVALPLRLGVQSSGEGLLQTPVVPYRTGGFDDVLVEFSELLPSESFLPERLG